MTPAERILRAAEHLVEALTIMSIAWDDAQREGDDHNARPSVGVFPFDQDLDEVLNRAVAYRDALRAEAAAKARDARCGQ